MKSHTAWDIRCILSEKGLLTTEIENVFVDLPDRDSFLLRISKTEESITDDRPFKVADATVLKVGDEEGLQKAMDNAKRVLARLADCMILSPTTITYGNDMQSTLTVNIGL